MLKKTIDPDDWEYVVKRHLIMLGKFYSPEMIIELKAESGLRFSSDGSNSASCQKDVEQYLQSIEKCIGLIAKVNAEVFVYRFIKNRTGISLGLPKGQSA
jgi:hypothetical protein